MTGIGANATTASSHELTANTAPISTMFQNSRMIVGAPTSRNRSSWLTSSLSTDSRPPERVSSKYAVSSCCTCV